MFTECLELQTNQAGKTGLRSWSNQTTTTLYLKTEVPRSELNSIHTLWTSSRVLMAWWKLPPPPQWESDRNVWWTIFYWKLTLTRMLISIVSRRFPDDINSIIECNMMKCTHKILVGGVNYIKSNLHRSKISFNTGVTWRNASVKFWQGRGQGQLCQVKSA